MNALNLDYSLPESQFLVDGKSYSLRYDFAALRAYQKETGDDPFSASFLLSATGNLDTFIWAGLRARNPEVTIQQILGWLTPLNVKAVFSLVRDAYDGSFPSADPERPPVDPPTA